MFKKFLALTLVCALSLSLIACGDKDETDKKADVTPTAEATAAPTAYQAGTIDHSSDLPADAASYVNFEDGVSSFATLAYSFATCDLASEMSVGDFGGSKALMIKSPVSDNVFSGKQPYVAIDVVAMLGDKAADVANVQFDLGANFYNNTFSAVAGTVVMVQGAANTETKSNWAIFLEEENPKVYKVAVNGGFDPAAQNYMYFTIASDNPVGSDTYDLVLDNIVFYDKDGKVLVPDTTKSFETVEGIGDSFWMNLDWSNGVKQPANEIIMEDMGVTTGTGWWPDAKNSFTGNDNGVANGYKKITKDDFKPGMVMTIYYEQEEADPAAPSMWQFPYIRTQHWVNADVAGDVAVNFDYQVPLTKDDEGNTLETEADMRNKSHTIVQYTYEALEEAFLAKYGEIMTLYGTDDWLSLCDFMGIADMGIVTHIYKITLGTAQ